MERQKGTRGRGGRRSKAESMTEAKANAVETRKASATPELPLPAVDKQLHYYDALKHFEEQKATIGGKIRALHKSAKAEGVDMTAIKDVMSMERGDQSDWRAKHEQTAQLMKAKGMQYQMSIFDTAYASPVEAAAAKGRRDAEAGRFAENTFPEGSLEDEAYQNAYMKVQTARVVQMKPPADAGAASDVEMAA